ncbi:MAG TPA: methyl-accepting chemotaxis protein, partial [Myxococcales bacterium]|nr:methyl-accepting chemotaxis protein [Myxococcales bacterium]
GLLTLEIPPGTGLWFALIAVAAVTLFTVVGDSVEQRCLHTLRRLGEGKLPPVPANLSSAAREAFAFPDRSFLVNIVFWCVGTLSCGLVFSLLPGATWEEAGLRIATMGFALGPITSTLAYLMLVDRSRAAVAKIAALGLSTEQVTEAWPPRRRQLRARLIWFTAVSVATPSLLVADVWQQEMRLGMDEVAAGHNLAERLLRAAELQDEGRWDLAFFVALVVGMGLAIAFVAGSAISRPLRAITDEARRVASGDLRRVPLIAAEDELWAAGTALADMQRGLTSALSRLQGAAQKLARSTDQLGDASATNRAGADEQMASLNETSATTEELAASAAQIAENGAQVAQMAERTAAAARAGQRSCQAFSFSMARMTLDNDRIGAAVARLNKRVQQIGQVVEFIQGIGDKADLLALNAELEGTKAGEVGRGFSLVAAEMRRLAETVVNSAQEIVLLITEIRDRANAAVMATESGIKAMQAGAVLADRLVSSLTVIVELADRTSDAVRSISISTQQQQSGTTQLAQAMSEILRVTMEAQAGGSLVKHHEVLSALAGTLQQNVAVFRIQPEQIQAEGARHG